MPKPVLRTRRHRVLMLLQNQWFNDPDRAEQVLAMYKEYKGEEAARPRFIRDMLFMGCLTGRRIKETFGEDVCWDGVVGGNVMFEEVSPLVGRRSGACFPPDPDHLVRVLSSFRPSVVAAFGLVAQTGLQLAPVQPHLQGVTVIACPHPAARGDDVMLRLRAVAAEVRGLLGLAT